LDFTGTGMGVKMPISPASMDLDSLCREVLGEFQAAHPTRTLRFVSHGPVVGEWDTTRLRQAISNLVGNAIQHGSDETAVDLALSEAESEVLVSVHNGGPPIPPE